MDHFRKSFLSAEGPLVYWIETEARFLENTDQIPDQVPEQEQILKTKIQ